jgi:hypothetical protein
MGPFMFVCLLCLSSHCYRIDLGLDCYNDRESHRCNNTLDTTVAFLFTWLPPGVTDREVV